MADAANRSRIQPFARALHELWYYERASAHVLAGWLVKVPDFDGKKGCGRALYQKMSVAVQIERSLDSLRNAADVSLGVPAAARERMMAIDKLASPRAVLEQIFLNLGPYLIELHRRAIAAGDELLNGPVLDVLATSLPQTRAQIQ